MYRIGQFAKIVNTSQRTLRFYDKCGVLKPKKVDVFTGYRYYTDENILEYRLITLLKEINFTLEEIVKYKDNISSELLVKKSEEILEKIKLLKLKYNLILRILNDLDKDGCIGPNILRREKWKKKLKKY